MESSYNILNLQSEAVDLSVVALVEEKHFEYLYQLQGILRSKFSSLEWIHLAHSSGSNFAGADIRINLSPRTSRSREFVKAMKLAKKNHIVVMDGPVPYESICSLVEALQDHDYVHGRRMLVGQKPQNISTWLDRLLARPFTSARDPLSNIFAVKKEYIERVLISESAGAYLGLEILSRSKKGRTTELPVYVERGVYPSKSLNKTFQFIRHLRHLANSRFGNWSFFMQFGVVGFSGTLVNLSVLSLLNWLGVGLSFAVALAILVSLTSNFILNRFITFSYAKTENLVKQYFSYVLASGLGSSINYVTTMLLVKRFALMEEIPQLAAIVGILAGMFFNFFSNRYWVFRQKRA